MARVPAKVAILHSPHFHITSDKSSVNCGDKLDTRTRPEMKLEWDEEHDKLFVAIHGEEMMIPENNIKGISLGTFAPRPVTPVAASAQAAVKPTAQVGSPQSHVFAGAGHGKTGK